MSENSFTGADTALVEWRTWFRHAVVRVFIIQLAKYSTSWRVLAHSLSIAPPYFSRMANDKCEILLPIHCRHEGVEVGGSLLYLFYRLPIYLQTNLESQRSQVYFAAWLVLLAGYIERILYWLCDCRKPSNFVRNHSRGFNTRLMTRHGQISPFFQKRGRGAVNMASHKSQTVR